MAKSGRKCDVRVEFEQFTNELGEPMPVECLRVWADKDLITLIEKVEGVSAVYVHDNPNLYFVIVDHRYDLDYIVKDIEAAIKCRLEVKSDAEHCLPPRTGSYDFSKLGWYWN